jgi:hypothetical protein
LPELRRTPTLFVSWFATMMSGLLSLLTSTTATENGPEPFPVE